MDSPMSKTDITTQTQKPFLLGLIQLCASCIGIWFVIWHVTPILVDNIPALAHYGKVAKDNDIVPSALYYNDVPVTVEAERNNRDTIKFLPHGGTKFD